MIVTANHRRAAVLSFLALLSCVVPGCAPRTTQNSTELSVSSDNSTLAAPTAPQVAPTTQEILSATSDGIGIEVGSDSSSTLVKIASDGGTTGYTVNRLENPPRLVIDLPGAKSIRSRSVALDDATLASAMRIGAHPDKSRIVLDLKTDSSITHEAVEENGSLLVTLRGATTTDMPAVNQSPDIALSTETKENTIVDDLSKPAVPGGIETEQLASATLQTESENSVDDIPVVAALPEATDSSAAPGEVMARPKGEALKAIDGNQVDTSAKEDAVLAAESSSNNDNSTITKITSVRLDSGNSANPMIVAEVIGSPEYRLEKTAPSEYVLTINKASLVNSEDASTLLADPKSTGIRSVRTTSSADATVVRIFSQPDAYLAARMSAGRLIVENTTDLAKAAKQLVGDETDRAQLDPKATEAKENKEKAEVTKSDDTAKPVVSSAAGTELSDTDVGALLDDSSKYTGRLISLDLQDTDIDNSLRIIAEVSNLNIVASDDVTGKVTLRLTDVPWDQALDVILKTNGLDKVIEGNVMRVAPVGKLREEREALKQAQQAEEELEPLSVKYLRVSYAKAAELKSLVETVLSERGTVAYDERSNQLIVKDVRKGLKNVIELVNKVDLRTPQVLLETQIVEATRNLGRELGAELGFQMIQSPLTGNGTGLNFPAAIAVGGSAVAGGITGVSFPVASNAAGGSAVTALFDSADGTKSLQLRLSALESEGRVRVISRPAVATTNNKAATIKSVEKVRVRLPNGGLSVATGAGAAANGAPAIATEIIEAGIVLDVTPQASPDYFVLLDIRAKSSSFSSREADGIPNEIERSASSTVLVSSGQTFALGGIYKIADSDRISGVPFFKDIPVLGNLFRRSLIDNNDEELLFFITPRIVEGSFDDASMKSAS